MKIIDALKALGSTKVVWVDDKFNQTPHDIADLLIRDRQIAAACGSPSLIVYS